MKNSLKNASPLPLALRAQIELELRKRKRLETKNIGDDDPIEWICRQFFIPEKNGPIELYPYQIAALRHALSRDDDGKFRYSTVLWGDIKKSAKSSIAAAVGLWRALTTPWSTIRIVANDLKQADSREAYYIRRAIELNPNLHANNITNYKIKLPNHSVIEAVPVDPAGEAGGGDELIIWTELWAARHQSHMQMWTEMTLSPLKAGKSQRWINTYAGYHGQSPILEPLYEQGVAGTPLDLSYDGYDLSDLPTYENGKLFCIWNEQPRLPWQNASYYDDEQKMLQPVEFARVHRNQWASAQNQFVPDGWWALCEETSSLPAMVLSLPTVMGLDAGTTQDSFGVVIVCQKRMVYIREAREWQVPPGGEIDFDEVEREVVCLCRQYQTYEIRYDPYQLHHMAQRLRLRLPRVTISPFSQQSLRNIADKQLYDRIRDRELVHPNIPALNEHIHNADVQHRDGKMRLVKRTPAGKIDLAVALSMASYTPAGVPAQPPIPITSLMAQGRTRRKTP